jgi:hypothetical protein
MSRNQAYDALLALADQIVPPGQTTPGSWGEKDRKWKDYTQAQFPALWQLETDMDYSSVSHGQMTKRKQQVYWAVIHNTGTDQANTPSKTTADFLDAVDARFINPKIGPITLNGLVYAVYIDGTIRRYPGDQDGIEIIIIPLIVEFP